MEFTQCLTMHLYSFWNADCRAVMLAPDMRMFEGPGFRYALKIASTQLIVVMTCMWVIASATIFAGTYNDANATAAQGILVNYTMFYLFAYMGFLHNGGAIIGQNIGSGNVVKTQ